MNRGLLCCLLLIAACAEIGNPIPPLTPSARDAAEQRAAAAGDAEEARRKAWGRILVVPGDLSRPYRILGPVRPDYGIQSGTCSVDALRQAALDEYKQVDAIIGATISADLMGGLFGGSQCDGTAVVFTTP